ncbi:hypothetical protein P3X46_006805 [Hevea brasiliensis]|uniref:G-patch domain-containing protein n=1 Tax=Hevea brasiliensis TaxID=3981 RepID=A0ABQ9MV72_HEVBR|nr:hypothetical protein P3X46_006805 [Hevea brasiliensis]
MGRLQELTENPAKKTASFGKKKEGDVHSITRQNNYSPLPQNNYRPYPPPHGQTIANIPPPFPNYPHPRPQYPPPTNYQPRPPPPPTQPRPPQNNPRPPRNPDPPLPLPLSEIYRYLVGINQIVPVPLDPIQPPYPRWYDATARCEYHGGAQGHSIDNCGALRGRVHALIRNGWLKIEGNGFLPNVTSNPLPNHNTGNGVNMIESEREGSTPEVDQLIPHFGEIFRMAMREGYLHLQAPEPEDEAGCPYHGRAANHELQNCEELKQEVQNLLSLKVLRCQARSKMEGGVNTARFSQNASTSKPRITFSPPAASPPVTIIQTPPQLPVTNTHAIPWNYNFQVFTQGASSSTSAPNLASPSAPPKPCFTPHEHFKMTYTGPTSSTTPQPNPQPATATKSSPLESKVEFITRNGRCYGYEEKEKKRGKVKMAESQKNTEEEVEKVEGGEPAEPKEEEELLLQIMKQSEYDVVEQLRKTPARISLLSLILSSEVHRQALQKILDKAFVSPDITPRQFEKIVGQIQAFSFFTFLEDEIDPAGLAHTKALHVTVKCKGCIVAKVLIDNGSALNVLPNATLARLPVDRSNIRQSAMVIRAFDGTRREVLGDIDLPLQVGACTFNVTFQVMNIEPAYTMLLGRPWIHSANAVPSTLHQKIKYIMDGKIIIVKGEEAMLVTKPQSLPYVEAAEESLESSFQALELQETISRNEGAMAMVAKVMSRNGYEEGKGVGAALQGIIEPIPAIQKVGRCGLGYEEDALMDGRFWMRNQLRDQRFDQKIGRMKVVPKIMEVFTKPVIENPAEVEESPDEPSIDIIHLDSLYETLVSPIIEGQELNNWTAEDVPVLNFE